MKYLFALDPTQFINHSKEEMLQKYDCGASKQVYDIVTDDESWIYAYDPESKQQSIVWVFQDKSNPTKVANARSTSKQMIWTCSNRTTKTTQNSQF